MIRSHRPLLTTLPPHLLALACLLAVGATGCDGDLSGPREAPRLGILEFHGESRDVVTAPDTVKAGEPFDVIVGTYGGGCDRKGDTDVEEMEGTVVITPIDVFVQGPDVDCPAILRRFEHAARVSFGAPGDGEIRVRGRRVPPDEEILLTRTVVVVAAEGS